MVSWGAVRLVRVRSGLACPGTERQAGLGELSFGTVLYDALRQGLAGQVRRVKLWCVEVWCVLAGIGSAWQARSVWVRSGKVLHGKSGLGLAGKVR